VLIVFGLFIAMVIFGFFVPKFRQMFSKMQGGLPPITRLVFGISDAMTTYGLVTAAVIGGLVFGAVVLFRKPGPKAWLDRTKMQLPIVGGIIRGVSTSRLCRLLGSMLANGVPMLAALQIARDAVGNAIMKEAVDRAAEAVKAGQQLAGPLEASGLFDDDVVEMIRVGESANNLSEVLVTVSNTMEERLDRILNVAIKLIEPLLLVSIAGLVGLVAAGLLLPLTKLSQSL
jgi:general secretion pathway protein F/type IV pilus assembly protein PilC